MAEPICEDEGLLQEWTPLTQLLQQIPLKTQRGLFPQNLNLTCLDVVPEFIAIGTNSGFVYWYCRATGDLQKLRFENCHCAVTCLKIMPFVDYMIAAGTDQGTVIVFKIPKIEPGSTPDQVKSKQKQIERFTINSLHQAPVTNVEWDPNEIRVFSGDKLGCVVLTEISLNLHISKSMELLNEQFEIVQLSFNQQILLISTVYRSIICDSSKNWKVHQVGTKERKILGKFGATLCKFEHGLMLYASRPGHRLWLSDKSGVVQQTLIFKSAIQSNCPKIQLINPIDKKAPYDTSFGKVIQYGDNKLLTYNSEILYVLHPGAVSIVSILNSARRILDLAVNENEIFILEGERSLLRLGPLPDKYSLDLLYQPIPKRTSFNLDEFATKIKDTAVESIKKITKDLIPTNEQTSPNSPPAVADEALELPPIVNLPADFSPAIFTGENIEIHSSVSDNHFPTSTNNFSNFCSNNSEKPVQFVTQDKSTFSPFNYDWQEEVITRPLRRRHNKKSKTNFQGNNLMSESESDTTSNISEDRLVCGVANDLSLSDESAFSQSQSSFSILRDIPSLLDRQKITQKNVAGNEELTKTSDTKSETSLDTCESVSERLLLTSETFREDQEKAFARLANQSLFDSFNSEKTDNMSVSLNMTISSNSSSKISENLLSPSYTSENSGVASRAKSSESQNIDNFGNERQPLAKSVWRWESNNFLEENSSQEENMKVSSDSSGSNLDSQRGEFYPKLISDGEAESIIDLPVNESNAFERMGDNNPESGYYESGFPNADLINESFDVKSKILDSAKESKRQDPGINSTELSGQISHPRPFPQTEDNESKKEGEKKENDFESKTFLLNEPLSYGPPSGSSMLGLQPSSDFSSIPTIPQVSQALVRDSSDHWLQYKTPERITSLAVCNNYVVCTDVHERVYYSHLSGLGLTWSLSDYKASMVRMTSDGSAVWLLNKKTVSALINPSLNSLVSGEVVEIAQDVKSFALDSLNKEGLVVTLNGKIKSLTNIMKDLEETEIICDYIVIGKLCSALSGDSPPHQRFFTYAQYLVDVASLGGVILAISNDCNVLCKLPEEEQFKVLKTLKPVRSLALGPENLLWVVDESNNIFFSDDYLKDDPHWWQVQISDYIFQNPPGGPIQNICNKIKLNELKANLHLTSSLIATNENSVWVFNKFDSAVWVNKTGFTGYMWNTVSSIKFLPNIQWRTLCAGGVFEENGRVWLLSLDGNIFCTTTNYQVFQSIPAPSEENTICMTSSVDTLWALSESGRIHSRLGLNRSNVCGTSWKELKSSQIDNLRFVWISCGCDVAWACDIHGRTFMTVGLQNHMAATDPTWVEVEGRPKDVQFVKVFVGSRLYTVWAIDTNCNLYVREGIFPQYQIGTNWVYVCGIEAVHVSICGAYVWALAFNGNIYRRYGVSESNCTGDYWRNIPGSLKMLSSTSTDELWGINCENKILRLSCNFKIFQEEKIKTEMKKTRPLKEDISWEIVK